MSEPTKADVEKRVFTAIAARANVSPAVVTAAASKGSDDLVKDLGIPALGIKALRNDLTHIAKRYSQGVNVPATAYSKAKTATACAKLTFSCATGVTP
jgi:hypothetical protein